MDEMVELEDIRKEFNGKEVLSGVSLKIKSGERFGIFGPSGCGKTTLLRIIAGLEKPDDGRVYLRGKEVTSNKVFVPPEKRNISFIFQDLALWPHMSVKEHLEFVLSNKSKNLKGKVERILKIIELTEHSNSKPEELSGGEKQRLAIGRAIAQRSDIFLLDEPLSSLDLFLKKEMINLLQRLQRRYKLTIVYVSHDIFEIVDMCNRIAVMKNGKISKVGHPRKLFKNHISGRNSY